MNTATKISPKLASYISTTSHLNMQRSKGVGRLIIDHKRGCSVVQNLFQEGCAKIRLPKSYDSHAEAVMINSSGGITGGDVLQWEFKAAKNTNLTITSQACERIYKSSHFMQAVENDDIAASSSAGTIDVQLSAAKDASLFWLPQETILFDGGALKRNLEIKLEKGAKALICESIILGRKEMDEVVEFGLLHDRWRVFYEDRLIHAEDLKIDGDVQALIAERCVTQNHIAFATLLSIDPANEAKLPLIREIIEQNKNVNGGASLWQIDKNHLGSQKLIIRLTGVDGYELRKTLLPLIELLKKSASTTSGAQIEGRLPKVWSL